MPSCSSPERISVLARLHLLQLSPVLPPVPVKMVKKGKSAAAAEASAAAGVSKKRGTSKAVAASSKSAAADGSAEPQTFPWARSQISDHEICRLKKSGVIAEDAVLAPGPEVFPNPPPGWRVVFLAYFLRGLQFPLHPFLRGLLFTYGIQVSSTALNLEWDSPCGMPITTSSCISMNLSPNGRRSGCM